MSYTDQHQPVKVSASALPSGPDKVRAICKELNPEKNERYKPDARGTWCNIFVTDVVTACGFQPQHWMTSKGAPAPVGKGVEMSANRLVEWLSSTGAAYGWVTADRQTAFDAAARGHLVVCGWRNPEPAKSGHVAILLPEGTIAQAGRTNFVGKTLREGFGNLPVQFFIQAQSGTRRGES